MKKKANSRKKTAKQTSQLGAYLAASFGSSLAVSNADAAIVFFNLNPVQPVGFGQEISFGSINLSNGSFVLGGTVAPAFTIEGVGVPLFGFVGTSIEAAFSNGFYSDATNFSANASVSSASSFSSNVLIGANALYGGDWFPGASGFLGLRINQGGGNYNYGWAQFAFSSDPSGAATISGFAFETDVNTAILAGDVGPAPIPEPGTWAAAALLLGGAAYARWRKRRDEAQKEAA